MSDNPDRISYHLGGPRVMEPNGPNGQLSMYVSRALDRLGKSQEMVKIRVKHSKELEQYIDLVNKNIYQTIFAGSKGEGLTSPYEGDRDKMVVAYGVICADNIAPFRHINWLNVLETDRRNTSPGYTKLRLHHLGNFLGRMLIQDALFRAGNGHLYFSSDYFFENAKEWLQKCHSFHIDRNGPAFTTYEDLCSFDFLAAFILHCPDIIQSFTERPRDYEWPSRKQLREIANLEGHVVPVGYKGSSTAFLEWRICYTKAERFLMRSLNDTQTKLYILLRMVAKTYINLVSKDITSYVLKNIVLWLVERCDPDKFRKDLLVDRLIQALHLFRRCIINNNLPSYMIPERNLFSEKLNFFKDRS